MVISHASTIINPFLTFCNVHTPLLGNEKVLSWQLVIDRFDLNDKYFDKITTHKYNSKYITKDLNRYDKGRR